MKLFSFWRSLATFRVCAALNYKGIVPEEVIELPSPRALRGEGGERR